MPFIVVLDVLKKHICAQSLLPKQTVNTVVMHYVDKGWIELKEDKQDRRVKKLYITKLGSEKTNSFMPTIALSRYKAMDQLSPEQQRQLLELTKK